jgi:hypothetical protein
MDDTDGTDFFATNARISFVTILAANLVDVGQGHKSWKRYEDFF